MPFGDIGLGVPLILQHVELIGIEVDHLLLVLEQADVAGLPASGIEEVGHGQRQCAAPARKACQGERLAGADRIGAEKRTLIVSKALDDALQVLGERHDFEEWQETVSTFLLNLAAAPPEESARFANMSRPKILIAEKQSRQLKEFAHTSKRIES